MGHFFYQIYNDTKITIYKICWSSQPSFPMMKDNKMPYKCCSCNLSIFHEKPNQILRFRSVANMLAPAKK
jgi:hypothetical protein